MKYYGTVISVNDIGASRRFYEDMFGLIVFQDYGRNISFVGGLSLMQDFDWLIKVPKEKVLKGSNNIELYFEEEDFDGFMKKLGADPNIEYLHDVIEQPWGQRAIRFYDPDQHIIEVGEDMKAVIKRFLNSGLSMEETAERMNVKVTDLEILLGS
jgi:catechol 2,3-dioxygenase-like lactoylglutathione lyase family enzyme